MLNQCADIIFHNGLVYTVDKNMSRHEAVAVAGNRILAVGTDQDILSYANRNTIRIDLQGNSVYPGFIDSHYHFNGVGKREYTLNLDGCRSLEEFLERVRKHSLQMEDGQWVIGRGW